MQNLVETAVNKLEKRQHIHSIKHPDNEGAFVLCKFLKKENISLENSEPYVDEFFRISTEKNILMDRDGGEIDRFTFDVQLSEVWDKVDNTLEAMTKAIEAAKTASTPEKAKSIPDEGAIFLSKVCRELSKLSEDGIFFLSQKDAGSIINKSHIAGGARLKALCRCGVLFLSSKGHTGKASEYTFIGDSTMI